MRTDLSRGAIKPDACFIIPIHERGPDPFFPTSQRCMHFVRHTGAPPLGCQNGEFYHIVFKTCTFTRFKLPQKIELTICLVPRLDHLVFVLFKLVKIKTHFIMYHVGMYRRHASQIYIPNKY